MSSLSQVKNKTKQTLGTGHNSIDNSETSFKVREKQRKQRKKLWANILKVYTISHRVCEAAEVFNYQHKKESR